ncbi:tRNA lysidine(34) synthetase TilS [Paradevosia shaoguanensis]|uniref:tRNA lysidine(34) synthetase TilS n=1 Tax=Paradevosia shaoguanensis TaxID=1335043 RepID=UPI0019317A34|nr:tRNA lysidine(34) synthetase TilS [Paradevosia shaoguanensis]
MSTSVTAEGLAAALAPVAQCKAIGLAVSGGADSLALMVLVRRWLRELENPPKVFVYSVDHGLRREARDEVAMVVDEAKKLGFEPRALAWTGAKPATGVQDAARQARYRLIGEAMAQDGAEILLTAHHINDQAETILMRLSHGSGLDGLSGMQPLSMVEGVPIFRPFLAVDPKILRAVVDAEGLTPAEDPSNSDPHYERVRWRRALPALADLGLDAETLFRFSERAAQAEEALAITASISFDEIVRLDGFGAAEIDSDQFASVPKAIADRILARVLRIVGGQQKPRALSVVERLRDALVAGDVSKTRTVLGCVVRNSSGVISVAREPGRAALTRIRVDPGVEFVWDERFLIANLSQDAGLTVVPAEYWQRRHLEELFGFRITAPMEAIRTSPMIVDESEKVLSLGTHAFDERVRITFLKE